MASNSNEDNMEKRRYILKYQNIWIILYPSLLDIAHDKIEIIPSSISIRNLYVSSKLFENHYHMILIQDIENMEYYFIHFITMFNTIY